MVRRHLVTLALGRTSASGPTRDGCPARSPPETRGWPTGAEALAR
jgi:hypothetical protein